MASKKLLLIVDFCIQIWYENLKNKFWGKITKKIQINRIE